MECATSSAARPFQPGDSPVHIDGHHTHTTHKVLILWSLVLSHTTHSHLVLVALQHVRLLAGCTRLTHLEVVCEQDEKEEGEEEVCSARDLLEPLQQLTRLQEVSVTW